MEACKSKDADQIGLNARNSSQAIAKLISSLKGGVLALRDCDEASRTVVEARKILDTRQPSSTLSYVTCQRELIGQCKQLVAGIAKLTNSAKTSPGEVGTQAKAIAQSMTEFANWSSNTIASATEPSVQDQLADAARRVFNATNKIIQSAKLVSSDSKSQKGQHNLSASYKEVTDSISSLVAAIKAGATGELKCEAALDQINRSIGELDGAALKAATGQLQPEDDDMDMEEFQSMVSASISFVTQEVAKIVEGAKSDQSVLGDAASDSAGIFDRMSKETRSVAGMMSSLISQQEILNGAKAVGITMQSLILCAKKYHDSPSGPALENAKNKTQDAIGEFQALVHQASATATAGIKELETARKATIQAVESFDSRDPSFVHPNSGASDVLRSAKMVADAIGIIQSSCGNSQDSDKLIKAASDISTASSNLLQDVRGVLRLTDDSHGRSLVSTSRNVVESTTNFLEMAKAHKKQQNSETSRNLSEASEDVVRNIAEFVESSRVLPDSEEALKLFQETDELEALAERELTNAANIISEAAKTLTKAKERQIAMRKDADGPLPEEEITEAILDAARAITIATSTLVVAATAAQKELVAQGKATKQTSLYRRDPAWAKGLISAAQSVAGTVKDLVGAANDASQGKAEEEVLIASAKGVAAATARLVFASRAKADPFSNAQKQLTAAARAVATSTQQLVEASQWEKKLEEPTAVWSADTQTEKRKKEMDTQVLSSTMDELSYFRRFQLNF